MTRTGSMESSEGIFLRVLQIPVLLCPYIGGNWMVTSHTKLSNTIRVCLSKFPPKMAHLPHYYTSAAIPHFHHKVG